MQSRMKLHRGKALPRRPRIIFFDLETAPNLVTAHSLINDRPLPHYSVVREKYIICGSWKVLGENNIGGVCVTAKRPKDDKAVVTELHRVLSSADAIVAHYIQFDIRTFNARAVFHGLSPLPPLTQIDTYRIAKSKFKLNSNRLDYIGRYLGLGRKNATDAALWDRCMGGEPAALREMLAYNKQDVRLLESVYLRLYPFGNPRLNAAAARLSGAHPWENCGHCGSTRMKFAGTQICRTRLRELWQCQEKACGGWAFGPIVKTSN